MLTHLIHVTMAVPDLKPYVDFYGASLGLPESGVGVDGHSQAFRKYRIGPTDLIIREDSSAVPYGQLADSVRTEIDHFALYVQDVDYVFETLRSRRVSFRDKPHTTGSGHRNMQRSLVSFQDPFGFTLQLSQAVDPRPELVPRVEAKKAMAGQTAGTSAFGGSSVFCGIDHVSTYCTDFSTNRTMYRDVLGLDEFFYSKTREEGAVVGTGFEQGAFAAGGTDIELASDDEWRYLARGPVRGLGFQVGDVERARDAFLIHGVPFKEQPRNRTPHDSGRSFLAFNSPDGMRMEISACVDEA